MAFGTAKTPSLINSDGGTGTNADTILPGIETSESGSGSISSII